MTVLRILKGDLNLRNVCAVWVPHDLTPEHKLQRVNCAKHIRSTLLNEDWRDIYAVEDETYVNLNPRRSKAQNRTWIPKDSPRCQVVKPSLNDKKCLLIVAFTPNRRFSLTVLPKGQTLDAQGMIEFIRTTGNKWRTLRSHPIHLNQLLWQMDNARPHSARATQAYLQQRQVRTVWQSPYSPDLNLCDRFLFSWLKNDLSDQRFQNHEDLEKAALRALRNMSEEALVNQVEKLLAHCQSVIDHGGDYITP